MKKRSGFVLTAAILMLLFAMPSVAQDRDDDQDPPARAGRVSYTNGSVSFQPGGQGDWLDAVPNRPLTTGDNLWADRNSRAEMQIGSTSIRLDSETSVTVSDLENDVTQLRLSMGSLFFRVRHVGSDDTFEVDTPNMAFNVTEPGEYRIDVNENGDQTTATVWHGSAEITGGGSSYRLSEGQQGTFSGVDQLSYDVGEIGRDDDFSRWCLDRDQKYDRVRSAEYVSPEVTGYEDLDEYGRWYDEPGYGHVWAPVGVAYDWAPYRYGHWVYVSPWGWTWVEDEPWGFAPFHYGRWAYLQRGWCWVPGPIAVAPVYSPALVAFVGGGGFHVGVGVGVGWFPLAPGEVYVPWYRTSPRYVQNVNITNTRVTNVQVTNVYNNVTVNKVTNVTYINQRQGRGITVVNQQTFVNARPVHNNIIRVDAREVQRAPVTHEVVRDIRPDRQSVIGTARTVRYAPPQKVMTRPVIATRQPAVIDRSAPVQGGVRYTPATPPPVRTVQAAPRGNAQVLQRGARGSTPGFRNAPVQAERPQGPNNGPNTTNRGAVPPMNGVNRGGNPDTNRGGNPETNRGGNPNADRGNTEMNRGGNPNANRPNVPRPGAPEGNGSEGAIHQNSRGVYEGNGTARGDQNTPANRPNTPNNAPVARPNAPDMNRPAQENNRPNMPNDNRGMRNVPRPSAGGEQPQSRPNQPETRPQQPQVNTQPEQPRSNAPYARPQQPDNNNNRNTPEPRPNYRNSPDNVRQDSAPAQARPQAPPPERDVRPQPTPRSQESRPEPQMRKESSPPPQRESRPAESRQEKGGSSDKGRGNDKEPPKGR
ncbi:MAG TPA: DUF6600 domain-containing protein [Terriglobales bacterium]|nr:DUF6600 domain-containing protein [Terriglobales bacterium]